jgi:hypothetical protein
MYLLGSNTRIDPFHFSFFLPTRSMLHVQNHPNFVLQKLYVLYYSIKHQRCFDRYPIKASYIMEQAKNSQLKRLILGHSQRETQIGQ